MYEVTSLRNGMYYQEGDMLFEVLDYEHTKKGRGNATIKVKVKNLLTGAIITKGYISGKRVDEANLETKEVTYMYRTNTDYIFKDEDDEELELTRERVGEQGRFLVKGMSVKLLLYEDEALSIDIPIKAEFIVKEAPPDARGNSANAANKEVILENGMHVKTPMFIKAGDKIIVDTRDGNYIERV